MSENRKTKNEFFIRILDGSGSLLFTLKVDGHIQTVNVLSEYIFRFFLKNKTITFNLKTKRKSEVLILVLEIAQNLGGIVDSTIFTKRDFILKKRGFYFESKFYTYRHFQRGHINFDLDMSIL